MRIASCLIALVLLTPAAAWAGSGPRTPIGLRAPVEMRLSGSGGYRVRLAAAGHAVALSVVRGPFAAGYVTHRGRVSGGLVRARFGRFGRVALRFHPRGGVQREAPLFGCRGRPRLLRHGYYAGTIRFRGERGYVRVRAGRARGTRAWLRHWDCPLPFRGRAASPTGPEARLERFIEEAETGVVSLDAATRRRRTYFGALGVRKGRRQERPIFFAGTASRRPGLAVYHSAVVAGPRRDFPVDGRLDAVRVRPPLPFRGSASFTRAPGGATAWRGPLRVHLPGLGDVRLAGIRFAARLRIAASF